jgi:hypothetical protein
MREHEISLYLPKTPIIRIRIPSLLVGIHQTHTQIMFSARVNQLEQTIILIHV